MKNLLKLFTVLLIAVYISSCTEDFNDVNSNPKALTLASLDKASYGFVFKKSVMGPSYLQAAGNGMQLLHSLYFDVYANYWATTTPNFLSDRYVMVGSWLNGAFNSFYASEAAQIKYSEDFARQAGLDGEKAMAKIWKVWCYHRYTDALGPIPYSQYGNMQKAVSYDKQQDIYNAFFTELDSAEAILKGLSGKSGPLGAYDLIYGGDFAKWRKFGNSLHLRLGMRIKYANAAKAKTECEKAVANGIITANADNGWITTSTDFQNPYNIISPWAEYRMSADMESILKGYLDPRAASYFKAAKTPDNTDDPAGVVFPYEGVRNGQTKNDRSTFKFDELGSDHAQPYTVVGGAGPKWFVMRAFEGYFLRAEGVLEGWNMGGGTVQSLYNEGITTSLAEKRIH
ncbi:MAG: SusD/RagB family nutrient-binding outer membrane lipoprotein [Bacteroidetes bacterium]|nr:SusD/RagB family nutrient-binding outer membrane lipoprotein [Bacteroidota bacterium]